MQITKEDLREIAAIINESRIHHWEDDFNLGSNRTADEIAVRLSEELFDSDKIDEAELRSKFLGLCGVDLRLE